MFTGIIEEIGQVRHILSSHVSGQLTVCAKTVLEGTNPGDSIAVNGVCLTVTRFDTRSFTADVMPETLRRSNLGQLRPGNPVNLERAVPVGGRFGGHFVSGHIDSTGVIRHVEQERNAVWIRIEAPTDTIRLIVEKGSVAIDGISLTVADVTNQDFAVSIIPHTGGQTTLLTKKAGDLVNLENDLIGKYVQKLLCVPQNTHTGTITMDFLQKHGF